MDVIWNYFFLTKIIMSLTEILSFLLTLLLMISEKYTLK